MQERAEEERKAGGRFGKIAGFFGFGGGQQNDMGPKKHSYKWVLGQLNLPTTTVIECPICLLELEPLETVTALTCSERHIYHRECLANYNRSDDRCALCRQPIMVRF